LPAREKILVYSISQADLRALSVFLLWLLCYDILTKKKHISWISSDFAKKNN